MVSNLLELVENRVLKARICQLRGKKLRLTDAERRRLAVKGRKALGRTSTLGRSRRYRHSRKPCWLGTLIARKWDYSERRKQLRTRAPGHGRLEISELVVGMAKSNPKWASYTEVTHSRRPLESRPYS